jgi:hypothetical protein
MEITFDENVAVEPEDNISYLNESEENITITEEPEPETQTYVVNGKEYALSFTLNRIDLIEKKTRNGTMNMFLDSLTGGMKTPTISDIKTYFSYGLKDVNGGYITPAHGEIVAEKVLEQDNGYQIAFTDLINTLKRDCPFFFPAD